MLMRCFGQRIRANAWAVRRFVADRRVRGDSAMVALILRLPIALLRRAYCKIAQLLNGRGLGGTLNTRSFRRFQTDVVPATGGHFYVIVMPGTLHFLLPCLALIPSRVQVILLANGATAWERRTLEQHHPKLTLFALRTLPGSTLSHGDVITLLLKNNNAPFGILDHDLYVFDQTVYDQLNLDPEEFALALFSGRGRDREIPYPHTFFLYFDPQPIQRVMRQFRVDARIYRRAPSSLREPLSRLGLSQGQFPKEYLDYFDTLQLLFAATQATGRRWRVIRGTDKRGSVHVGGTSFSARGTKDASQLYIHLRFLEISPEHVRRHYSPLVAPFRAAAELRPRLCQSDQGRRLVEEVDALIERLTISKGDSSDPTASA